MPGSGRFRHQLEDGSATIAAHTTSAGSSTGGRSVEITGSIENQAGLRFAAIRAAIQRAIETMQYDLGPGSIAIRRQLKHGSRGGPNALSAGIGGSIEIPLLVED